MNALIDPAKQFIDYSENITRFLNAEQLLQPEAEAKHVLHVVEAAVMPGVTAFSPFDATNGLISPLYAPLLARSRFNAILDACFYNVMALTDEERAALFKDPRPEGSLLIVGPRSFPRCDVYKTVKEFLLKVPDNVDTVVVAGVGSSIVGTAALAREVADHLKRPVAGVVSGYGYADFIGEGLGGWFGLGTANAMARTAATLLDVLEPMRSLASGWGRGYGQDTFSKLNSAAATLDNVAKGALAGVRDADVLSELLADRRLRFAIGHSKGNFVIDNALKLTEPFRNDILVVTLGAPVYLPATVKHHQVLGGWDLFGLLNTRSPLGDFTLQPFATHRVKEGSPFSLHVSQALTEAKIPVGQ